MSTTATVVLVAAALGAGVYVGVKLTKAGVLSGVDDAADKVIRMVGGDPTKGYGRVAHTLIDQFGGGLLG